MTPARTVREHQIRHCTPVVVRPPRTVPISEEDNELAVYAIATMIARWWDANGRKMPDTENHGPDHAGTP